MRNSEDDTEFPYLGARKDHVALAEHYGREVKRYLRYVILESSNRRRGGLICRLRVLGRLAWKNAQKVK